MKWLLPLFIAVLWGASAGQPFSTPEASQCGACHGEGLWDPPMVEPTLEQVWFTDEGGQQFMHLEVSNPWLHHVTDLFVTVETRQDVLSVDVPTVQREETLEGTFPMLMPEPQTHVWSGAADAQQVTLTLEAGGTQAHDLAWRFFDDGEEADVIIRSVDGKWVANLDARDLMEQRNWTMEVFVADGPGTLPEDVPYTITIETTSGPVVGTYTTWQPSDIEPYGSTVVTLPINSNRTVVDTTLIVFLHSVVEYDHEAASDPDVDGLYTRHSIRIVDGDDGLEVYTVDEAENENVPGPGLAAVGIVVVALAVLRRK